MSLRKINSGSTLLQRSVVSVSWNVVTQSIAAAIMFVRSVVLARLLPIEIFGIYAGATAIVGLTSIVAAFGFMGAFVHRAPQTENEEHAAAVYFTLQLVFTTVWMLLLWSGALLLASGATRVALIVITTTYGLAQLTDIPSAILVRRVVHRRLALLKLTVAGLTTITALTLAWFGSTLWALLATELVTAGVMLIGLYIWQPIWRPRLVWHPETMRYFLSFGSRTLAAYLVEVSLQRVDNLWTQTFLGNTALGYYSRAYTFATYPRQLLAIPIASVASGAYAELKNDRLRLSKAFYRTMALLVRSGFLLAGGMALVAPEFIRLLLSEKWLPILTTFQLMLLFMLFDPIRDAIAILFVVVGEPGRLVKIRLTQLAVLVTGFFTLGWRFGITGVAISMDLMLVTGIVAMFYQVRRHVDFTLKALFGPPLLALLLALAVGASSTLITNGWHSDWVSGGGKGLLFLLTYGSTLWFIERAKLVQLFSMIRHLKQANA